MSRLYHALVEWLAGLLLGLLTALLLVALTSTFFPGLEDYGFDQGIRLAAALDQLPRESVLLDPEERGHGLKGYVFLDVDPGGDSGSSEAGADGSGKRAVPASVGACKALVDASSRSPGAFLEKGYKLFEEKGGKPPLLDCQPSRYLNRFLLAELINGLRERNAKLVILDVILAKDQHIFQKGENETLQKAMKKYSKEAPEKVIYAIAASGRPGNPVIALDGEQLPVAGERGVVIPGPDPTLRRYPKCLVAVGDLATVDTLPYLAARKIRSDLECDLPEPPARIFYSLPSLEAHADSTERDGTDRDLLVQRNLYGSVYVHCLAENFWNLSSECNKTYVYKDKIVVIGASNPLRRDRHYTPLGDMAGAEVVINAIRSFVIHPKAHEKGFGEKLGKKLWITFVCSFVWLLYFLCRGRASSADHRYRGFFKEVGWICLKLALFVVALILVVVLATYLAWSPDTETPSLDVLIPVLAVALEIYAEKAVALMKWIQRCLNNLLERLAVGVKKEHS